MVCHKLNSLQNSRHAPQIAGTITIRAKNLKYLSKKVTNFLGEHEL